MAQNQFSTAGLLPSGVLQPYGQNILKYGIGQLGTPIDVGALTPKVAGQTAFQQKGAQRLADMYGMGDIQRDATGMVTGFQGATGIASFTDDGGSSWRGVVYFNATAPSLASLNGIAVAYSWDVDGEGNATWELWALK